MTPDRHPARRPSPRLPAAARAPSPAAARSPAAAPSPGTALSPVAAGHPVGTEDPAWCRFLLWAPEVDPADRRAACTPLAHRPGRRAVLAEDAAVLRRAAPGLVTAAFVALVVGATVGGAAVGASLAVALLAVALAISAAATATAVRRAGRSAAADERRRALRGQLATRAVDPTSLAQPWRRLADDMARLQHDATVSAEPEALSAVEQAAGQVAAAIAADAELRAAGDAVRRVVAAAPDADADADALRSRLAEADTESAVLVADVTAALAEARLALSVERSGRAALESARLRALGDLDRAVLAARAVERRGSGQPPQAGSQET